MIVEGRLVTTPACATGAKHNSHPTPIHARCEGCAADDQHQPSET